MYGTRELNGFHGEGNKYPIIILVFTDHNGTWYTQQGGTMVFMTEDEIFEGVNIDDLCDEYEFSYSLINTVEGLIQAVES